jgi:calcium load-activated calcium channel
MLNALSIIGISLASCLLQESFNLFIYSTTRYKTLKAKIDALNRKIEGMKSSQELVIGRKSTKKSEKELARYEDDLKLLNWSMATTKMYSFIFMPVVMISVFSMLYEYYGGSPVARLPFEPISLIRHMSHSSLKGDDFYECSFLFIYVLSNVWLKPTLAKVMGSEQAAGPSLFPKQR